MVGAAGVAPLAFLTTARGKVKVEVNVKARAEVTWKRKRNSKR